MNEATVSLSSEEQTSSFLCPLPDWSTVSLAGEDARDFLQGQVTCDVKQLSIDNALHGAHCNFKGKMWSNFVVVENEGCLRLMMQTSVIEASLAELRKYGVFSKSTIDDTSDQFRMVGLFGEQAEKFIEKHFNQVPQQQFATAHNHNSWVTRLSTDTPLFIMGCGDDLQEQVKSDTLFDFAQTSQWHTRLLQQGFPTVTRETSGEFVPQMMNLQAVSGISFNKGCYMGQEVVARTHFLGKNKRALFVLEGAESQATSGDTLEIQMGNNWRRAGTVINTATHEGVTTMTAVLSFDTENSAQLRLKDLPQNTVTIRPLPYQLEEIK